MSYYIVAFIEVKDQEGYQKYQDGFAEVFEKFDGEIVVVNDAPTVVEGDWDFTRVVVLRFPSQENAEAWYTSPGYQAILPHRQNNSRAKIVGSDDFMSVLASLEPGDGA